MKHKKIICEMLKYHIHVFDISSDLTRFNFQTGELNEDFGKVYIQH